MLRPYIRVNLCASMVPVILFFLLSLGASAGSVAGDVHFCRRYPEKAVMLVTFVIEYGRNAPGQGENGQVGKGALPHQNWLKYNR